MSQLLSIIQVVLAVLMIAGILLQQSDSSLGGAFGGGDTMGGIYHTRRGAEKFLFYATIVISILFAATALFALYLNA